MYNQKVSSVLRHVPAEENSKPYFWYSTDGDDISPFVSSAFGINAYSLETADSELWTGEFNDGLPSGLRIIKSWKMIEICREGI